MKHKLQLWVMMLFSVLLSINQVWGAEEISMTSTSVTQNGITVACAQANGGSAPAYTSNECRLYASNTVTVSSDDNITAISFVYHKQGSKTYIADVTASDGTYTSGGTSTSGTDNKTDTWSGSAKSITFTMGNSGQRVLVSVTITTGSGGSGGITYTDYLTECAPSYTVSAVSNNESWGTVSVSGTTITANPKSGYRVVADAGGYIVTAGTATVAHEGNSNTLTVTPSTDCTVRVNFEAIPMTTINWVVGGQAYSVGTPTTSIATGSQYSALTLPTAPADNTIGDCADHFMGWSTSNLGTTLGQSAPAVLFKSVAGNETEITGSEITFYAVFATGGGDVALNGAFADRTVGNGGAIDLSSFSKTINGITYAIAKNSARTEPRQTTAGAGLPECVRLFAKNSMTISVTSGNITQIVLTQYDGTNALTANVGTYDADTKTWTGSASSVTFTVGGESGHNKYTNISVTTSNGVVASDYVTECVPEDKIFYLNTGGKTLWDKDDQGQPKFAIYYMGGSADGTWSDFMTETCTAGIYEGIVPGDATQIIFVRLKNTCVTPGSWDDKWNQTADLDIPNNSDDQYTIGAWDNSKNSWGVYVPATKSISFDDKGADNGDAMAAINDVACGSDQKLPTMTRTKTGHDFAGWATTDGGEVVYADGATIENVRADIRLFAKWNVKSYTLTWNFAGGETSATEGSEYTAGGSVEYGADINYPADNTMSKEGYHFTGWSSTPATMPNGNLTLTAQWEINSYDVKWYVNGVEYENGGSTSVNHGAAMSTLTLPTAPEDDALFCKDKFMGWSETDLGRADGQDAPADLFTSVAGKATTITGEKNFYAVFADAEGGGEETIVIDLDATEITVASNYSSGAERTWTIDGVSFGGKAICKGSNGTPDHSSRLQIQRDNGVIYNTTALSGAITSIAIDQYGSRTFLCQGGNSDRLVNSTSAEYTASGTAVGSASATGWTSTDFIGTNYTYFVVKSPADGTAYVNSITITYGGATYSNYVTRCCTPLAAPTNLAAVGTTHGITFNWTKAANATGYRVTYTDGVTPVDLEVGDVNTVSTTVELECGGGTEYTWSIVALYSGDGEYCAESEVVNAAEVVRTAYCSCDDIYSFHYGTKNADDWNNDNPVCFEATEISDGNSGVYYFSRNFTMPNKSHYYVGWAGGWNTTPWKSSTDELSGMPFFHMHGSKTLGTISDGSNVGAIGTLCIRSSYNDNNKYIDFIPGGYVLKIGENYDSYAFQPADADNVLETVWTTDLMTLDEDMLTHKIQVLLKTATGSVWSPNMSSDADVNGNIGQKSGAETWGTNLSAADAGKQGKFRIWADNDGANWNVHFVPFVQASFDANGGSCGSVVMPAERVSVEAEASARTITLPEATKTGHSLLWSDGANTYAAGAEVELTADMAFTAQWMAESYGITYHLNEGAWNGEAGAANYIYGTGVATIAMNVERDGYRFEGWFDNDGLTGDAVTSIAADALGAKEFWAKWTRVYTVQFEENGNVDDDKTVLLAVGENTTLPSTTISECNEYDTFEGWVAATVDETTTKPGSVLAGGASYTLATDGDVTLKALYSKCEGDGPEYYAKVTNMSEVTNGTYIIATDKTYKNNSSTEFGRAYLAKDGTNSYSTVCTPTFDTEDANVITNSADAMEFTLTLGTGDKAGKFAISDGTYYLSAPNGNNITYSAIASGAVFDWEIMDGSTEVNSKTPVAGAIHSIGQSARFMQMNHNNGTPRFACYAATQKDAFLYKKTGGCVKYYATNPDCSVPTEYVVTYKPNTENGGASHDDVVAEAVAWDEASTTKTVATCGFTASNAAGVFAKWNTQADGSGDDYAEGAEIVNYNGTLYAIWENHYTVTLYDGDHDNSIASLRQEAAGAEVTLPSGTLGCPGDGNYTFVGWTTDATMYDDQAVSLTTIDAGGYVPTDDVNLYAVYSKSKITPDFALNCNGGNYNLGADNTTLCNETNNQYSGYTYEFWNGEKGHPCSNVFSVKKISQNTYTIQDSNGKYLIAMSSSQIDWVASPTENREKWTIAAGTNPNTAFRLNNNGESGYALAKSGNYFEMKATGDIKSSVYDITFTPVNALSYQSNPNCEAEHAIAKVEAVNGSFTVTDTEESPITLSRADKTVVLNAAPATGYELAAWNVYKTGDEGTTVTVTDNQFTMPDYDVTVAATFAPKNYTVTLNNNGATTAGEANVTATYGAMLPSIAGNLPEKTGYTFEGYYSGATQYINALGEGVLAWTTDGAGELTARWTEKTTSVTFYANNGSEPEETSEAVSIAYASAADATFAPTKTSHRFTGYYTTREDDGVQIYDADKHMLKNVAGYTDATGWIYAAEGDELSLYARWEEVRFTVTYVVPTCQTTPADAEVLSENSITLPAMADLYEYKFVGWHAGEAVSETTTRPTLLNGEYTPTDNVELHAVYAVGEYENAMVGRLYANVNGTKKYLTGEPYVVGSVINTIAVTETAADAQTYTITPTGSGVTISYVNNESATKYLYVKKTGSGSNASYYLQAQEEADVWTMSNLDPATQQGTVMFTNVAQSSRAILYRAEYNYVRAYSTTNLDQSDYYALNIEETTARFPVMTSATYTSDPDCPEMYERSVATTTIGTICLPKAVDAGDFSGATFYQIVYKDNAVNSLVTKVYFDEVDHLEAGKPYIFIPTEGAINIVCYMHGKAQEAQSVNGLVGVLGETQKIFNTAIAPYKYYAIYQGMVKLCAEDPSYNNVPDKRAYIDMDAVPTESSAQAPIAGRKRIALGNISYMPGTATGIEDVEAGEMVQKVMIDNKIFILRGGKMYSIDGKLVK